MDIPIGSKWIREGQEFEVVDCPSKFSWGKNAIWIKRKDTDGYIDKPRWLHKEEFLGMFIQVEINLENK